MGAVFAARHLKLSKAVAIKIMLADASNPEASTRFINEGRAAANIQNEHVVRVDDVDEEMGYAYMVLELLEGQDLAQILEATPAKRLPPHVAVNYVLQGLKGVSQAHALGIVHRDLKPSNLFLAKRKDGTSVVKVLDFGISKATGQGGLNAAPSALTSTKAMLGSPLYMSPEQLRNAKSVDHRADIWAMGIILYELITGALPFMGENLGELFAAILETDPRSLRELAGDGIPQGLNDVVMRCLQRRPDQRFQSAIELMQALAPFEQPMAGGGALFAGTAVMPGGGSVQTGNVLHGGQAAAAMSGASTTGPHLQPMPPQRPATASQPNFMPPQLVQTTGSGWQQGSGVMPAPVLPKSNVPLLIGLSCGVALIGALFGIIAIRHRDSVSADHPPPPAVSSVAVAVEPAVSVAPPDLPAPAVSVAVPSPVVSVSVPRPAVAVPANPVQHNPVVVTRPPVPPPAPLTPPKPTNTGGGKISPPLEGNR
jgi:serine/threonine-protein kinase